MSEPFGRPGVPPAVAAAWIGKVIEVTISSALAALPDDLPDEVRDAYTRELADHIARIVDGVVARPAEAGDLVLVGEAAEDAMRDTVLRAFEEYRREAD